MGLLDRPRVAAVAAAAGWSAAGRGVVTPTHVPLATMDNRAMMERFKKDLASSPGSSSFGGGWQSSMTNLYRTGPARLRALANSYGGTSDSVSWVFSCTSLVASTLASYPYRFADDSNETIERPPEDLVKLLKRPNPRWTYFDLMEALATDLELVGNAYVLKNELNALGKPKSLYRLRPDVVRIATRPDGTVMGYVYSPQQGMAVPYDAEEVIHFRYPNPLDDYYGMGTVEAIGSVLDEITAERLHLTGFFQNGARISGVLTVPGTMTETQFERLTQSYQQNYAGAANAYKFLIAEGGGDYKPIVQGPAAAGVVDLMKLSKDETLAAFGVPAPLLGGVMENANYKMEESQHIFTRAMIPRTRRIMERFSVDLIFAVWGINLAIDAHANEPLEVRIAHAKEALAGGGGTVNEARELRGEPPSDDPMANKVLIPNNLIPLELAGAPPRPGRSIPMGDVGEPGSAEPPAPAASNGASNGATPLQDHLADLPAAVATSKDLADEVADRLRDLLADRLAAQTPEPEPEPEPEPPEAVAVAAEPEAREAPTPAPPAPPPRPRTSARVAVSSALSVWGGGRERSPRASSAPLPGSKDWVPPDFPRGFEAPSAKAAETEAHRTIREHQARALRVGVDAFEPAFRKFFKAQRDRVLQALSEFGSGARSARLRHEARKAKDDLTPEAIFDAAAENEALVAAYLPALDEVGKVAAEMPPSLSGVVAWDLTNPRVEEVRSSMAKLVTRVNETTRGAIADVVSEGMRRGYSIPQIANGYPEEKYGGVMGVFDDATGLRAETIARSESAMAFNAATAVSYRDASVEYVDILDGEGDDVCAEANGSTWTLDEFESNSLGHPNCSRCAVPSENPPTGDASDSEGE